MFYVVPKYVEIHKDFEFDTYFSHHNTYDRRINHMFLNGEYHDGIMLCNKKTRISEREWTYSNLLLQKKK